MTTTQHVPTNTVHAADGFEVGDYLQCPDGHLGRVMEIIGLKAYVNWDSTHLT